MSAKRERGKLDVRARSYHTRPENHANDFEKVYKSSRKSGLSDTSYIPRRPLQVFYVRLFFQIFWVINKLQPTTTTDSIRTKMKNMSNTMRSNNSNNLTSLSSPAHMDFLSRAEEIVVCNALLFKALFVVTGNLVTIVFFALEQELRKQKSLSWL